ncbi:MAG: hypothetical protein LBC03_00895, partial [Nitrososphaerota archaeon]|nr:hypothetical protein [Nitrososphaerota archaeon]
ALLGVVTFVDEWWMIGRPTSYYFSGVKGDWSNIVVMSFDPLSFTVLPSTSTPSTNKPDQLTPDLTNAPPTNAEHTNASPTNSSPQQQKPWIPYLLTIITLSCIIIIPIVVTKQVLSRKFAKFE